MNLPKAKNIDIVIQDLGKELLVYDLTINKVFSLNETSKLIYQACDGKTSFDELKQKHRDLNDDVILLGLNELSQSNMLEETYETEINRRILLQKAAISVIALPTIIGLAAPNAIQARSCVSIGQPCDLSNPGTCCSRVCYNGSPPYCG